MAARYRRPAFAHTTPPTPPSDGAAFAARRCADRLERICKNGSSLAKLPNPINTRWRMIYPPNKTLLVSLYHYIGCAARRVAGNPGARESRRLNEPRPHGRVGSKQSIARNHRRNQAARFRGTFFFASPLTHPQAQTLTSNDLWRTATSWYFGIAASLLSRSYFTFLDRRGRWGHGAKRISAFSAPSRFPLDRNLSTDAETEMSATSSAAQ